MCVVPSKKVVFLSALPGVFGVLDHADAVELRPLVIRRAEVRVALHHKKPPLRVEVERDGVNDVRGRCEQLHHQPLVGRGRRFRRLAGCAEAIVGQEACREESSESTHVRDCSICVPRVARAGLQPTPNPRPDFRRNLPMKQPSSPHRGQRRALSPRHPRRPRRIQPRSRCRESSRRASNTRTPTTNISS